MFRKSLIAIAALATVGAAAFAVSTTTASADGYRNFRHHYHWRPAFRYSAPAFSYGSCYVRRVIGTPFGPRVTYVNICG